MIIAGYVFTALNYACYCYSRFVKEKKNMLLYDIFAKIFTVIGLYCLGSLTGAYNMIVSLTLLLTANIRERKSGGFVRIMNIALYSAFEIAYITIMTVTFKGLPSVLITITSSITLLNIWWLPPQKMRLVGGFNSILFLTYQLTIKNWAGLLEILVLVSNFTSYFRYRKKGYDYKNGSAEIDDEQLYRLEKFR